MNQRPITIPSGCVHPSARTPKENPALSPAAAALVAAIESPFVSLETVWALAGLEIEDFEPVLHISTFLVRFIEDNEDEYVVPCTCELVDEVPAYSEWAYMMMPQPPVRTRDFECLVHGDSVAVKPGQDVADKQAFIAQNYAGYLVGYSYHSAQYGRPNTSKVDRTKPWREPNVLPDNCVFCDDMTDESVIQRVAGYQSQIDKEVIVRNLLKASAYTRWVEAGGLGPGTWTVAQLRRKFCETFQDGKVEGVNEWTEKAFPLVDLPMRLKRKMCIEWNHTYIDLMKQEDLYYDFSAKEFRRNAAPKPADTEPTARPRWVFPTA